MKTVYYLPFTMLFIMLSSTAFTQENGTDNANKSMETLHGDSVFQTVEVMPEFPGGRQALFEFIGNNVKYPKMDKDNGTEGESVVMFIIEKDGSVSGVQIYPGLEGRGTTAMHKEAIRVIESMPRWTPGIQKGKKVRVKFTLPIRYKLRVKSENKKKRKKRRKR